MMGAKLKVFGCIQFAVLYLEKQASIDKSLQFLAIQFFSDGLWSKKSRPNRAECGAGRVVLMWLHQL